MTTENESRAQVRVVADKGHSVLKSVTNFSKIKADETPAAVKAPVAVVTPASANDSSVISINVEMSGTIVSPDELHIAGKIEGKVRASSITIRASGTIKGDVVAETVIVYGRVEGASKRNANALSEAPVFSAKAA